MLSKWIDQHKGVARSIYPIGCFKIYVLESNIDRFNIHFNLVVYAIQVPMHIYNHMRTFSLYPKQNASISHPKGSPKSNIFA
jgi:hypothetical protein